MITFEEFQDLSDRVISKYHSLLSIYKDEIKEYGQPKENTIRYFNALFMQMDYAASHLDKGLVGLFPWED